MLQKSIFIAVVTCLVLAACSVGLTNAITPIRISQVDGIEGVVSVGHPIHLEVVPIEASDNVTWSLLDSSHPGMPCAEVDQSGIVIGVNVCGSILISVESTTGATDNYPMSVEVAPKSTKDHIDKKNK